MIFLKIRKILTRKIREFGSLARHSWGIVGAQNSRAPSWGTVGAQLRQNQLGHSWAHVGHSAVGAKSEERREKSKFGHSWGIVQAHLGHTFISGTVGAQNIFNN